jgi:hypothetical protein
MKNECRRPSVRRENWQKIRERLAYLPSPTPPAEKERPFWREAVSSVRANRSKRRKKQGLRCAIVLITEEHLDALCKLEWLPHQERTSQTAIQTALNRYLYSSLVEKYLYTPWAINAREERANRPKQAR